VFLFFSALKCTTALLAYQVKQAFSTDEGLFCLSEFVISLNKVGGDRSYIILGIPTSLGGVFLLF